MKKENDETCPCEGLGTILKSWFAPSLEEGILTTSRDLLASTGATDNSLEPNPPNWGDSVVIISNKMSDSEIQSKLTSLQDNVLYLSNSDNNDDDAQIAMDSAHENQIPLFGSLNHFSSNRTAILFHPGQYNCSFQVAYYTQVLGVGKTPQDVCFTSDATFGPYISAVHKLNATSQTDSDNVTREYIDSQDDYQAFQDNPNTQDANGNFLYRGQSLDTFWRIGENYSTMAQRGQLWAVSQAAPLRRVIVEKAQQSSTTTDSSGNLYLHDNGAFASGGHMANCQISDGNVEFGSQQQWCNRNVTFNAPSSSGSEENDKLIGGAWNLVFVNCINPQVASPGAEGKPSVTVDSSPLVTVEKPYIVLNSDETTYSLCIPQPQINNDNDEEMTSTGANFDTSNNVMVDFTQVYVANPNNDSCTDEINAALAAGKHVVLSPGIYNLTATLEVSTPNQVILGLGLATLMAPTDGTPCIHVAANTPGVRLAGFMLGASDIVKSDPDMVASLLEWGDDDNDDAGDPSNPGVLSDIFCRVGGPSLDRQQSTDIMVRLHSGNIVGDNLWLWRADHTVKNPETDTNPVDQQFYYHQTVLGELPVNTGLEVNGDNVTIHGLAIEHTIQDQLVWNGENGNVQFYQCELPYDVTNDFATNNYKGYRVNTNVQQHDVGGIGVYCNFRDYEVQVQSAIQHPNAFNDTDNSSQQVVNAFTVKLENNPGIDHVITDGTSTGTNDAMNGPTSGNGIPSRFDAQDTGTTTTRSRFWF